MAAMPGAAGGMPQADGQQPSYSGASSSQGPARSGQVMDEPLKKMIIELQRHWLNEYHQAREKMLVELTEKLHQEYLLDTQKQRQELLAQFKEEMDATRTELEDKYYEQLKQEINRVNEKKNREISSIKKKQWCWQCESEAIYHCCWNTSYCSTECQQAHWPTHRKFCRRKKTTSNNQ